MYYDRTQLKLYRSIRSGYYHSITEVPGTLLSASGSQSGGVTTFDFSRNLDVAGVRSIPATGESIVLYAYGSGNTFSQHPGSARGALNVDFSSGTTSAVDRRTAEVIHGALMFIAWGVLLPAGVFGARFLKDPATGSATWFHMHRAVQVVGLIFAIGAFIIALDMVGGDHFDNAHKNWGLAVMCLGVIQPLNAVLRPEKPQEGEKPTMVRRVWEVLHKVVGYGAIILGHVAIHYGLDEIEPKASDTVFALHHVWWALTLVIWIVLSLWQRMRVKKTGAGAPAPSGKGMAQPQDPTAL